VAPGETLGGVDPALSVEPLLGSHPGTLTWIEPGRSTACHLDIDRDRTEAIDAPIDCDNAMVGFDVDVTYRLICDDGSLGGGGSYTVKLDPGGRQGRPIALVSHLGSPSLVAGVTRPAGMVDYYVDLLIPIYNLTPDKGTVRLTWWDASRVAQDVTIGDIVFQ
jgi:hypothetical protein